MGGSMGKYKVAVNYGDPNAAAKGFDWLAKGAAGPGCQIKADSFENLNAVGKGKFGLVFVAKTNADRAKYVGIKYIPKNVICELNSVDKIQHELDVLGKIDHPFAICCYGGFETSSCIAVVMEFAVGGELYHRMKQRISFSEAEAKFYFCELASVLRYLHEELNLVYRDLKPENVLLDYAGHVKLCDFGFATPCATAEADLKDTCGTVMYIAPELVNKLKHGFAVDWWALGCVLVEMVTGDAPFGDSDHMNKFEIFNNITEKTVRMPLMQSSSLKALVKGLLHKDQHERFSWVQVCQASWLKDIDWKDVERRRLQPPWIPSNAIDQPGCVANFVAWDLSLPTALPNSEVQAYCRNIKLPRNKGGHIATSSTPTIDSGPLHVQKSMKRAASSKRTLVSSSSNLNLNAASDLAAVPPAPAMLTSSPSMKMKKAKSSKVAIAADDTPLAPDPEDNLYDSPKRSRSKSQRMRPDSAGKSRQKSQIIERSPSQR